ncbi:hypothetical protein LSH36_631g02036 [Paralvinella palmiformis]|uniref:Uncharacterized protein n=1 Tax=Paralvinella palmiformis TaxID=53620 RepID=A0AAD9J5A2_9ANNE|nr:hypothetical protein LSH36_631g02036 [Paralvinella palmiformis]
MSAVEKVKKKKGKGPKGSVKGKNKKVIGIAPDNEDNKLVIEPPADEENHGSVISVQEANEDSKQDYVDHKNDNQSVTSKNEKGSNTGRDPVASTSKNISRPTSVTSQHSGQLGSVVSIQSKEAWTDNRMSTVTPNDKKRNQNSSRSLQSQGQAPMFAPAEMNENHAYVPFLYARDSIAKITEDMKKMKGKHVDIIRQIDLNYKNIEDDTQTHFNMFVVTLQQKYVQKVRTFRQVIEVHRIELNNKQQYWDEMLQSLSQRNKQLLNEKKQLLILNKQQHEKLEQDKENTMKELTQKLNEKEKEVIHLREKMKRKELKFEEDKERELRNMENTLRQEWNNERQELEETIEELRNNPIMVTATQSLQQSSVAPTDADHVAELERKVQEKDTFLLLCKETSSKKDAEHEKEKTALQHEIKKLEQQVNKLKKKLTGDVDSDSDLEKQVDDLEEKIMHLELALMGAETDKQHYMNISKDQKDYITDLEDQLSAMNTRVSHLQVSAAEAEKSMAQLSTANRNLEKQQKKVKKLEDELMKKSEEMSEQQLKAEKLRSDMEKDMKKMLKEIAKLRKQLEESEVYEMDGSVVANHNILHNINALVIYLAIVN